MPRRHFRSIKEARQPPQFERVPISEVQQSAGQGLEEVKSSFGKLTRAVQDTIGRDEGFAIRRTSSGTSGGRVYLPGSRSLSTSPHQPPPTSGAASQGTPGWVAVLAVVAVILMFGGGFWSRIKAALFGGRKEQGGRWVRDRSLGGKMVFIPDDEAPGGSMVGGGGSARSPLDMPLTDAGVAQGAESQARARGGRQTPLQAAQSGRSERPAWWVYTPPLLVSEATRLECRKRAKRLLKQLENQKLMAGQDYDAMGLVTLYQACREGNVDIAASVATTAGRDAMLRAAVAEALRTAGAGSGLALSLKQREFVCGLSEYLGVPQDRAVTIVHAATAAEMRAKLLSIAAGARSGAAERSELDTLRLLRIADVFPLPATAAEAAMVGAALRDKFTLAEMESLLKSLALRQPQHMALFTVLLGFDLQVTLPMLEQYVADHSAGHGEA